MSSTLSLRTARMAAAVAGLLASGAVFAQEAARSQYNMPVGVTEISREVFDLHMLILWVVTAIGVIVFGVMGYSIFAHRRSRNPKPADFHHSTTVEIIWTIIPFVILVGMAIPAAGTLIKMEDTRGSDMSVKVTGFQWGWKYDYVGQDVSFTSMLSADSNAARQLRSGVDPKTIPNYLWDVNNPLVLPVGKKVRFLVTGQDVIHAWWVFDLAVKKDAIPGIINETWTKIDKPGIYRGVCAELCGRDHGFMPIVVKAVPEAEYMAWLAKQKGVDVASLAAPAAAVAAAPAADVTANDAATVDAPAADATATSAPAMAKLLFGSGAAALPADADASLKTLVDFAKANPSARLAISGFHDASGSAAKNAELAKQRALAVKAALIKAGVAESALEMKKPEQVNGGTADEARRVEVSVATAAAPAAEAAAAPAPAAAPVEVAGAAAAGSGEMSKDALLAAGKKGYETNCAACHQQNGQGMPPNFPSLVGSKIANGPAKAHIQQTLKGKGLMPPFGHLSDADIAAILSYQRTSWGNKGSLVQAADVKAAR